MDTKTLFSSSWGILLITTSEASQFCCSLIQLTFDTQQCHGRLHGRNSVHYCEHQTTLTSLLEPHQLKRLHNLSRIFCFTTKRFSLNSAFLVPSAVLLSFLREFCAFKVMCLSDYSKDNTFCQRDLNICHVSCRTWSCDHTTNINTLLNCSSTWRTRPPNNHVAA